MPRAAPIEARSMTFPAPVGGWNARDAYDGMEPKDAITLINWVPDTGKIRLRRGSQPYGQQILWNGVNPPVQTIAAWSGGSSGCLLAVAGNAVFRIDPNAVTYLGIADLTSNIWQYTMFSTLGGIYTLMFSGFDPPMRYDGTTLTTTNFTAAAGAPYGLNQNDLICVTPYQQRLFMGRNGTLQLWYGDVGAIDGELNCLDLGSYCRKGGGIACVGQWTRPTVYGTMLQMLVVVTSNGEVLLFNGTDPSNASDWTMYGIYEIGQPVSGHRQINNLGPECILICADGFQPLSAYLSAGQEQALQTSISAKIGNAVSQAVGANGGGFGWESVLYPLGNALYVNVPNVDGTFDQYCVNTLTAAWYRLQGMKSYTWCTLGTGLFYGTDDGLIMQADTGTSDNGAAITATWQSSYQYPRGGGVTNQFTMARPVMLANGAGVIVPTISVQVDFAQGDPSESVPLSAASSSALLWDQGDWDSGGTWDASNSNGVQRQWVTISGVGYSASVLLQVSSDSIGIEMHTVDVLYKPGAFL
jgi:hypothetical protein